MTAPLFCLLGPTAIGKSLLGEQLAELLDGEIISVDSALIYRGMDIGTAKPSLQDQQRSHYHLLDILDPTEKYSVGEFYRDTVRLAAEIRARSRVPLLVGGTMMYFQGLWHGLADLPEPSEEIRQQIEKERQTIGLAALYARLQKIDPASCQRIKSTDPQRIQRALEVYELTGRPMSQLISEITLPGVAKRALAIVPADRHVLHQRIQDRFHAMLKKGFLQEVELLFQRSDLNANMPSMRAVGYRQAWQYLAGQISYEEMVEQAITATRQLAKRQLTWIRSMKELTVIQDVDLTLEKARSFFDKKIKASF